MSRMAFMVSEAQAMSLRALNYDPGVEALRSKRALLNTSPLSSFVKKMGASYSQVFTRLDCDPEHGVELLSQSDMFAVEPRGRVIRRDSMPRPDEHAIQKWQVLIAGAGQMGEGNLFGKSIIADERLVGKYLGGDAVDLTFKNPGDDINLFAYAFINTRVGIRAVRSCAYGTSIPHMRLDLLGNLPIPIPGNDKIIGLVARYIGAAVKQRERYVQELLAAREVIELLPEMKTALEMCGERRARAVVWSGGLPTMSAWTFASAGEALSYLSNRWSGRVADVVESEAIFRGGRYARIPCEAPHGIELLSQRDVFFIRPMPRRIVSPPGGNDSLKVPEFSLLAGGQGTLGEGELFGQVSLVTSDVAAAAVSEHLLRIQPGTDENSAVLYAYLSTKVGRRLLRTAGVGTKLLSLRPDLVRSLPMPDLDKPRRKKILNHLIAACAARTGAVESEARAFELIETSVLPTWLA